MRAVQIRTFGEPGIVLELADLPEPPAPAAGQVLIGVEHAPINMNDLYLIQGIYPVRPSLPSVVGNEGVGRVLAIGRGVDHLNVGDRVLVPLYSFSWRERLVAPAAGLFALPEADARQLAMLGINPPTAALLLNESIAPLDLIAKRVVVKGFFLNHPDVELKIPGALRETAPLVASGAIRVPIAATYPLTAFREAVAHVQRGGKVMFDVDGASESRSG